MMRGAQKVSQRLRRLLLWLARHRVAFVVAVVYLAGYWVTSHIGPAESALVLPAVVAALVGWRLGHPGSFRRWLAWPLRGRWRRARVYRRRWQAAMMACRLAVHVHGREFVPRLVKVASTATVDKVTVQMLVGQVADDYAEVADRLAQTFGAADCRVRPHPKRRGRVDLWLLIRDPLTVPVKPLAPSDPPKLAALPVGTREDGLTYAMKLLGTHLLVAGATGAGKGSVLWSLLAALGPGIRCGLVKVWALDPKGGMELAAGRPLFERFCYGDPGQACTADTDTADDGAGGDSAAHELEFAQTLEDAVDIMRARQAQLRGVARLHTPTAAEPFIVVMVDELASLTAYVVDRTAKRRIASALSLLLSQGRAVGVTVVGALQDPRKEVLPFRDLFPTRVGLRLSEADQVRLVLGDGARERGARCEAIAESLPGIGYVGIDGVAEPVRVRFWHITDNDVARLVAAYSPGSQPGAVDTIGCGAAA